MYPSRDRIQEIQDRFVVRSGRVFGNYRYSNLNWYLGRDINDPDSLDLETLEWFCYGDVRDDELTDLQAALQGDEVLVLGWKNLSAGKWQDNVFGNGGGVWLMMTKNEVIFDRRENEKIGK